MKTLTLSVLLMIIPVLTQAEELLRTVSFSSASESGTLLSGEVIDNNTLTITAAPQQVFYSLIELADPGITSPVYALQGMIRYDGVQGDAYLQLDNYFAGQGTFFTKSLASTGPLQKLSGSSDWRQFVLPFFANQGDQGEGAGLTPEKLSLSLYLPGSGSVSIRDVGLYQYAKGENPLQAEGQWIGSRGVTLMGAIGGSLIGIWGALIGFLTSRAKARGFVLGSATALIVIGAASFVAGTIAFATGQPYGVYYPLLLIGVILVVVIGSLRKTLPHRYEAHELKKMQAMDA